MTMTALTTHICSFFCLFSYKPYSSLVAIECMERIMDGLYFFEEKSKSSSGSVRHFKFISLFIYVILGEGSPLM